MNRERNNARGGGAMRQKVWKNQRITPLMANSSKPTANEVPAATNNGNYHRRIPWRRNPAPSRPSRTQPYQIPGKSTQLNEQCFDLGTNNDYKYPSDHADTNNTNRNAQNQPEQCYDIDTKDRIPTEYSKTNGTGENAQNSRELNYDVDNKDRIPTEYAQMNGAYENNHNSRDDAKNRIPTEYAQTNRTYQNYQNPRPQRVNFDARNRFRTKYNEVNGTYGNTRNSREQYSDFVAKSHPSAKYAQRNETLKRLQRWGGRQQARDNVKSAPYHVPAPIQNRAQERGYYTTEPPSERTQQNRAEERGYYTAEPPSERIQQNRAEERGYYTAEPPSERIQQNRAEERGYYTTEHPPERTQQPRMQEYPKAPFRKIWTTKIQPKNTSKVAPAQSADTELKSVSNFIQPSPWFSAAEKVKSSYQNKQPEIRPLLGLAYEDIFETPHNKPDTSRNTVRRGWNASDYANKTLDDDIVPLDDPFAENTVRREWNMPAYAKKDLHDEAVHLDDSYSKTAAGHRWNASDYAPKDLPDDIVHLDNSYSKNSVDSTSKWVVPPELNMSIQSGVFFAKVCEAVLEKVLQQLCPDSRKATQKPGAESLNARLYSNRGGVMKRSMVTNGSSLLRNKVPQRRPAYAQSNIKNRFNEGYKKYAPKPSFRKPQLPPGVSSGRVEKRKKILTRNGKSLIYV